MITRQAIVDEAMEWMGTRWRHQCYSKGLATDCIGLIAGVALVLGIPGAREWSDDPKYHSYGRTPDPRFLIDGCELFLDRVALEKATMGDILVMAFSRDPQHFALISRVDPMYVIHAYAQRRKVVENGVKVSGAKVLRAYRFRGVA